MSAVIGAALLTFASILFVGPSHADDTFIYMRYVDNVLKGHGLTFNPGEASYGFTSTAWPLLMVGPAAVFGNTVAVWKAASWVGYFLLCFWVVFRSRQHFGTRLTSGLIAVAVVTEPHFFRWSGTGMENALVALAILALLTGWWSILQDRGSGWWMAAALSLSPFVRPELAVLAGLIVIEWAMRAHRRRDWAPFASTVTRAGLVAVLAACGTYWATGFWLPQTATAKALTTAQATAGYGFRQTVAIIISGCAVFLVAAVWVVRSPQGRALIRPALVSMLVLLTYLAWHNHLVSSRYSASLNLPLMFAVMLALDFAIVQMRRMALGAAVQIMLALTVLAYTFPGTRTDEGEAIRVFAERVRAVTNSEDRIAMSEIGAFGFYADRYIIDLLGLVDPQTVEWVRRHGRVKSQEQLEALLLARHATYFVDSFAGSSFITGRNLKFIPLTEAAVTRNNSTAWRTGLWRLYKIETR